MQQIEGKHMKDSAQNTTTIKILDDLAALADYSFVDTLNPDPQAKANGVDHSPREVFSGHYVLVNSTPIENPQYIAHSKGFFEELGFPEQEAAKLKIKAQLMCSISEWIKEEELKQEEASHVLHVTRPRVSDVMRGKTSKFTIDALIDMLERTGKHVTLQVN